MGRFVSLGIVDKRDCEIGLGYPYNRNLTSNALCRTLLEKQDPMPETDPGFTIEPPMNRRHTHDVLDPLTFEHFA